MMIAARCADPIGRVPGCGRGGRTSTRQSAPSRSVSLRSADVDRRVAAELARQEGDVVGPGPEAVGLVPEVVPASIRPLTDPRAIGLAATAGASGAASRATRVAALINVGVRDEDVVEVGERPPSVAR
jgi:hypothetical protein